MSFNMRKLLINIHSALLLIIYAFAYVVLQFIIRLTYSIINVVDKLLYAFGILVASSALNVAGQSQSLIFLNYSKASQIVYIIQ